MRYFGVIFSLHVYATDISKEEEQKELKSEWDWKDLPGMAPDYASPVETIDYGDMPGAPGGISPVKPDMNYYGTYNAMYDMGENYDQVEEVTQSSRSVRHLSENKPDTEILTYPDTEYDPAIEYDNTYENYDGEYSYSSNYNTNDDKGEYEINIGQFMEKPRPPADMESLSESQTHRDLAGHQKEPAQRMFMPSENVNRNSQDSKLLLQNLKDLPVQFNVIEWRFETFDGHSDKQLEQNQYFHHDDSDIIKKTFLVLFNDSPDGQYILILRNDLDTVLSKTFNVRTVEETCNCVFSGQETELPIIQETTIPLNPPVDEEIVKQARKMTPRIESTTVPIEITDRDTNILTLLNVVSQGALTAQYNIKEGFVNDRTENEILAQAIRDDLMQRLASKGIAGQNLECLVSNSKILSSIKFWSFSTDEKHIGCFEVCSKTSPYKHGTWPIKFTLCDMRDEADKCMMVAEKSLFACERYKGHDCVCETSDHITVLSTRHAALSLDEEYYRRSPIGRYAMYSICPQCN